MVSHLSPAGVLDGGIEASPVQAAAVPRTVYASPVIHRPQQGPPVPGLLPPAAELLGSNMPHGIYLIPIHRISDELRNRLYNAC